MSNLKYYTYPGFGERIKEQKHYSQAVRVPPNRVERSGQGGWDPETSKLPSTAEEQIAQTFKNCDFALKNTGVANGLKSAFSVRTYHVGTIERKTIETVAKNMKEWMPDHYPIWTMLGVNCLALPEMQVEIDVVAFDEGSG